jgi:hypothetical protein
VVPQANQSRLNRLKLWWSSAALFSSLCTATVSIAQQPLPAHPVHHEFLPPGAIAQDQLRRHAGMAGYVQAVELIPPPGARVSILQPGTTQPLTPGRVMLGMQLGYVYSIKLTQLPNREGVEVFPTVEVINRIYPPEGTKTRFPIPIEITEDDVAQALSGLFVTRVVYLEDSDQAFPRADDPQHQRSIDVSPREDPLHVADQMGRPVAIVRLGSRVPDPGELSLLGHAAPPVQVYPVRPTTQATGGKNPVERHGADIPREVNDADQRGTFFLPRGHFLR